MIIARADIPYSLQKDPMFSGDGSTSILGVVTPLSTLLKAIERGCASRVIVIA
jgi:hypothetical protein